VTNIARSGECVNCQKIAIEMRGESRALTSCQRPSMLPRGYPPRLQERRDQPERPEQQIELAITIHNIGAWARGPSRRIWASLDPVPTEDVHRA
jgi:hypothetical protein